MDLDASSRFTCREALAHPWIADGAAADINIANSVATQMRKHFIKKKWKQAYNATAVIRKMRLLALASTTQLQGIFSPFMMPFVLCGVWNYFCKEKCKAGRKFTRPLR